MQGNTLLRNTYKKCPIKINYFSCHHLGVIWTYKDSFIRSTQFFCSVPALTAFSRESADSSGQEDHYTDPRTHGKNNCWMSDELSWLSTRQTEIMQQNA